MLTPAKELAIVGAKKSARLTLSVLSVYDLEVSEAPNGVTLSCLGRNVTTGPPSARHKDRNSFRFDPKAASTLTIESDQLSDLYNAQAMLTVRYNKQKDVPLTAPLPLNTLFVHETAWLILHLQQQRLQQQQPSSSEEEEDVPTLRVQVRLEGPYRTEIRAILGVAHAWFGLVDQLERVAMSVVCSLPTVPSAWLLVPTVPFVTAVVVLSPVLVGVLVVFVPLLLPALVILLSLLLMGTAVLAILYASTRDGRERVGTLVSPLVTTLLRSRSGQGLLYETGPRPTPVAVARTMICPTDRTSRLVFSLILDACGSASYLLPLVGEGFDLLWAPIQTTLIVAMYNQQKPLHYLSFFEELLPFTDVIPSATIGWLTQYGPELLQNNKKP